jgi:hypothetical protein
MGSSVIAATPAERCGRPLELDADTRRGGLVARRNVLFGLWVARQLGLLRSRHEAYAWSVHFADFEASGDEDVIRKVARDLAEGGRAMSDRQLRHHLREMELQAYFQLSVPQARVRVKTRER